MIRTICLPYRNLSTSLAAAELRLDASRGRRARHVRLPRRRGRPWASYAARSPLLRIPSELPRGLGRGRLSCPRDRRPQRDLLQEPREDEGNDGDHDPEEEHAV